MKNLLLLFASLAITTFAIAQNPNYSIRDSINYVFEELNQTYITTGILYEKASPTLNWEMYSNKNDTITSVNIWNGVYKVLRNGSFSQNYFLTDDSLDNKLAESREDNVVPLLILNYKYERLKPYVMDSNLLFVSGKQLFDVAERTESPYSQHRVFNASAAFKVFYGSTARFIIDSGYYFTNDNTGIAKIECNWGDGIGYRTLNWGDTIAVAYPDENARLVSSRIILVSGDTLASSFYFKIMSAACDDEYPHDIIAKIEATIPYPEGAVYPTATTSAKYTVTYGFETDGVTKHTCIKNQCYLFRGLIRDI